MGAKMRICVAGAGGTGGHFGAKLGAAGHEVSVMARGAHLAAIERDGLTLLEEEARLTVPVRASADAADLGMQDFVLVGVKATGLRGIAAGLGPLVGPETMVGFPQNGMAWWYPLGLPPALPAPPEIPVFGLQAEFLALLGPEQIVGGSIYSANEVVAPGVVRCNSPGRNSLSLGLITPGFEDKLADVRAAFSGAGIAAPAVEDIRRVMWSKLLMNMSGSVIGLAAGTVSSICRTDPALGAVYRAVLAEGLNIAAAYGYDLRETMQADALLVRMADHKPSLLQDYEQRRPMEIAEIVQAPLVFARAAGVAAPTLEVLAAIVTRRAMERGLA
jgi:2-dehydropantoate 2-reductase